MCSSSATITSNCTQQCRFTFFKSNAYCCLEWQQQFNEKKKDSNNRHTKSPNNFGKEIAFSENMVKMFGNISKATSKPLRITVILIIKWSNTFTVYPMVKPNDTYVSRVVKHAKTTMTLKECNESIQPHKPSALLATLASGHYSFVHYVQTFLQNQFCIKKALRRDSCTPQSSMSYQIEKAKTKGECSPIDLTGIGWGERALGQCSIYDLPWKFHQPYTALDTS